MSINRLSLYLLAFIITSCSFNRNINVRKAVDINPDDVREIKNVVILNRTAVPKGSKFTNVLEGVITGEVPMADRNGAEKCVNGLRECLQHSLNYKSTQLISVRMEGGSTTNVPSWLSWQMVDSLCKMYDSDLLVSLDFFDSNSGISTTVMGKVPAPQSTNTNNAIIKTTWRVYNRVTRKVVDDFTMETYSNTAHFKSPYPLYNIADKANIVNVTGYNAGVNYGFRISEQYLLESRTIFTGGNSMMKAAGKMARRAMWDEAFKIWEDESVTASKRKVQHRALHNMAVYYERMGNLEMAYDKAREAFNVKPHATTGFMMDRLQRQLNDRSRMIAAE